MMSGTIKDMTQHFTVGRKGIGVLFAVAVAAISSGSARASTVYVDLRMTTSDVIIGEKAQVEVWFVSEDPTDKGWVAADLWFKWNAADVLNYQGRVDNFSFDPAGVFLDPPNTMRFSATSFDEPVPTATAPGTLVTTLLFETKSVSDSVTLSVFQPETPPFTSITGGPGELLGRLDSVKFSVVAPEPATAGLLLLGSLLSLRRRRR